MSELKECPFCGGEAELLRKGDHRQSNQVSCMDCGAELEDGATFNYEGAWNTRPREEELEKENNKLREENAELTSELSTMDKAHYKCSQRCLGHIEENDNLKKEIAELKDRPVTIEMLAISETEDLYHFAGNLNAILKYGYCKKCKLTPNGCAREGCGEGGFEK